MPETKLDFGKKMPELTDVIQKIKNEEHLCAEEEYVYLVNIEGLSPDEALSFVEKTYSSSEQCD